MLGRFCVGCMYVLGRLFVCVGYVMGRFCVCFMYVLGMLFVCVG